MFKTFEDLLDDGAKELVLIMQKCKSCGYHFFESKNCDLCQSCKEKNMGKANLTVGSITRMKKR